MTTTTLSYSSSNNPPQSSTTNTTNHSTPSPRGTTTTTTTTSLAISFNQDSGCFAVGTDQGFRIYNVDPFQEMFRRDFSSGGVRIVEMLFRSNILAIVGGGINPRHPSHKVIIWDDHQSRSIGEMSFKSTVLAVRLRRDRVFVIISQTVFAYNFRDLKLMDRIDTWGNPLGLCAVSTTSARSVLACPGRDRGTVRVELYDSSKTTHIAAHESDLVALTLNPDGTLVATASERGTLVRVFDSSSGSLMHELRRGAERAQIYSVAFHPSSAYLACSSDKGTIHVFSLVQSQPQQQQPSTATAQQNNFTSLTAASVVSAITEQGFGSLIKGLLPKYFSSEWSYAQFRVPEMKTIVAFGAEPNTIVVVGVQGVFYKAAFDKPGEMTKKFFSKFFRTEGDGDGMMTGGES